MIVIRTLICFVKGHKRGRRISDMPSDHEDYRIVGYECPRCEQQWDRRVKVKSENHGAPGDEA